jgi:hypothetical protein
MSPRILLFWYLKPWCIKTFPPRLPDINLAGMITNFIYEGGRLIRFFMPNQNTHVHEDVQITRSEIKNRLVQKVKQDPSLPIKRIYDSVVREHGQGVGAVESIPPFPYIPWEVDDVEIEGTWLGIVRYFFQ